jgi:Ni,Fe-hydrogenase I cytochrome b subunit
MKLSRRQSNLLLAAGLFTLFSWITRAYTWYANDLQDDRYLALLHFPIIVIFLIIGVYTTYLGVRGRRAS